MGALLLLQGRPSNMCNTGQGLQGTSASVLRTARAMEVEYRSARALQSVASTRLACEHCTLKLCPEHCSLAHMARAGLLL